MSHTANDAFVLAFCGIDGSGKSSLINRLEEDQLLPNARFARKSVSTNVQLVSKLYADSPNNPEDWLRGPFAESIGAAWSLDFASHYLTEIEPALSNCQYLVCDRYVQCASAILHLTNTAASWHNMLRKFTKPNLIVFIDTDVLVASSRWNDRGSIKPHENEIVQRKFREAYSEVFKKCSTEIFTLSNNGGIDSSYAHLSRRLSALVKSQ